MARKKPISLKKLGKGDGAWSNRKTVLGWNLNTVSHLLHLPPRKQSKVEAVLRATSRTTHTTSQSKWRKLLGLMHSIAPSIEVSRDMFIRVQNYLKRAAGRHVHLTADVND